MLKFKTNKIFIKELVVTHFGALHKQTKNLKKKRKYKKIKKYWKKILKIINEKSIPEQLENY